MINDLIQAMNSLRSQPRPPLALAASYQVIDFLKRSPLFIEASGQTALAPSALPMLIALKNADLFGLEKELFLIPDNIALKAVSALDDFLGRGSSLKPAVVKQLLEIVREEYRKAWPYEVEIIWEVAILGAAERCNQELLQTARKNIDALSSTLNQYPLFKSESPRFWV